MVIRAAECTNMFVSTGCQVASGSSRDLTLKRKTNECKGEAPLTFQSGSCVNVIAQKKKKNTSDIGASAHFKGPISAAIALKLLIKSAFDL